MSTLHSPIWLVTEGLEFPGLLSVIYFNILPFIEKIILSTMENPVCKFCGLILFLLSNSLKCNISPDIHKPTQGFFSSLCCSVSRRNYFCVAVD